jgi:hypothetical protein
MKKLLYFGVVVFCLQLQAGGILSRNKTLPEILTAQEIANNRFISTVKVSEEAEKLGVVLVHLRNEKQLGTNTISGSAYYLYVSDKNDQACEKYKIIGDWSCVQQRFCEQLKKKPSFPDEISAAELYSIVSEATEQEIEGVKVLLCEHNNNINSGYYIAQENQKFKFLGDEVMAAHLLRALNERE